MALKLNGLTVTSAINGSVTGSSATCSGLAASATTAAACTGNAATATNANAIAFTEVELNAPATTGGTWTTGNGSEWGEPKFGTSFNQYRYADGDGPYVEYNVPANHKSCFISQLQWDTGGYVDCHGVQSDGDLVFLRRINSRQTIENSNHGNTIQHDGSTVSFVGSGLEAFSKIRITNKLGRLHMTGIAFTRQVNGGYEGTGMVHPAQISHQGSGSGLNADLLDGYNSATANTANTIVLRDASGNFSAGTVTGTFAGNITGNVTGNVSGSSGTCSGLAASATTAAACTGNAAGLSATLAVTSGGTGATAAAGARTNLGATTLGANLFTLANVAAISFPRINADNTVSSLDAAAFRTAIGAGTGGGSGTVTGVTASAPLASSGGAAPDISLSGAVALANGGSGQTSAQAAMNAFAGAVTNTQYLRGNGTNVVMSAIQVIDVPILNQNTTGSSASCSGTAATANALNTANNYTVAQMTVSTSATPSSYVIHTGTSPSAIRLLAYTDSTYIQSGTSTSSSSADLVFSSMQAGAEWMRIKGATGRLGIGTSTPAYLLDVNGTIHYTTLTASSDGRFKKNVQPIPNALDRLSYIRGVKFEWNEFINDRRNGYELNKPTFGVIAQELEEVFPELITLWKLSDDCTDARSVNYEKIIPILIEAVKELNNKNKLLESRLLILENK